MPPSIVYVHSHDTGRYVQPYGSRATWSRPPGAEITDPDQISPAGAPVAQR